MRTMIALLLVLSVAALAGCPLRNGVQEPPAEPLTETP